MQMPRLLNARYVEGDRRGRLRKQREDVRR